MTDFQESKLFLLSGVQPLCLDAELEEFYIGLGQGIAL